MYSHDEVTALDDWELYVKRYYDLRYPLRFVCTSSAAAFLKERSRESLAGRISAAVSGRGDCSRVFMNYASHGQSRKPGDMDAETVGKAI